MNIKNMSGKGVVDNHVCVFFFIWGGAERRGGGWDPALTLTTDQ